VFRADILLENEYIEGKAYDPSPKLSQFEGFELKIVMIRRMIPRNVQLDKPLEQTCLIYSHDSEDETKTLVVYLPHISSPEESPFYHPAVQGVAFLHTFRKNASTGTASIHYSFFPDHHTDKLQRTAMHLLKTVVKHCNGLQSGYVKRVHHDVIIPQAASQNTYARLKTTYAKKLIESWVEVTDPAKHVFEDLGIAAFLIELWKILYSDGGKEFPGFVDIGCGNGLLTHILIEEGYKGWGFDARRRKSWETYPPNTSENLKELVLIPSIIQTSSSSNTTEEAEVGIQSGLYPKGTFIISNHADELTPWTPLLGTLNSSPWIAIPCCSHALTGSRFRAPAPKDKSLGQSQYASLVAWVEGLAREAGWVPEREMLRIPSTRNTCIVGRERSKVFAAGEAEQAVREIVQRFGGAEGWEENAMKLVKAGPRGH
jgi:tRNASer (uridine44-2'-O)-methyltransferase